MRSIAILVLVAGGAFASAQSPATPPGGLAFEVASIRPNKSGSTSSSTDDGIPGRYTATNVTLRMSISSAYGLNPFRDRDRLVGPAWIDQDRFDIAARGSNTSRQQVPQMLQGLLTERFNLRLHTEMREQPVYALVLAGSGGKMGPGLKPATECDKSPGGGSAGSASAAAAPAPLIPCGTRSFSDGRGSMLTGGAIRMVDLAGNLTGPAERVVIDRTGLAGTYNVELRYARPNLQSAGQDGGLPVLFTALQEQLGLKLEPLRAPVEVFVIDRIEQPTPD
jgi:uncharacterized protein (TIGR03435 family)